MQSDVGIGVVLSQLDDTGNERVMTYGSRFLSKLDCQYCITRRDYWLLFMLLNCFIPTLLEESSY